MTKSIIYILFHWVSFALISSSIPKTSAFLTTHISRITKPTLLPLPTQIRKNTTPLHATSGAKQIPSTEIFTNIVLTPDTKNPPQPILIFFSAPWCGPCRLSNPVVRDVMQTFTNKIQVYEVCTDDLPDVASDAGVASIPTIQIYYKGEVKDTIVGCVARNVLSSAVDKVLEDAMEGKEE